MCLSAGLAVLPQPPSGFSLQQEIGNQSLAFGALVCVRQGVLRAGVWTSCACELMGCLVLHGPLLDCWRTL